MPKIASAVSKTSLLRAKNKLRRAKTSLRRAKNNLRRDKNSPTLRDQLFEKLVLGSVSCILVQSQLYEYLNQREYPPERGYDRKTIESNCKIGRVN
jgi:hypothetical protein